MADSRHSIPPHYVTLGVAVDVTQEALTKQFRRMSMHLHPDRAAHTSKTPQQLHAEFQSVSEAYHVLSNPEQRVAYDVKHGVNFGSRVSALKASIGRTTSGTYTTTSANSRETPSVISCMSSGGHAPADTRASEDDEEDDEEYVVRPRSPSSEEEEEEEPADHTTTGDGEKSGVSPTGKPREKRKRLWVQPLTRHLSDTGSYSPATSSAGYVNAEQWKEIQMRREYHRETGKRHPPSLECTDLSWGIVLSNVNTLIHARAPGIPFPSRIERWNSTTVDAHTDMPSILRVSSQHSGKEERQDGSGDATNASDPEEATMLVSFMTEQCELIGDLASLQSRHVLESLVGPNPSERNLSKDKELIGAEDSSSIAAAVELEEICAELPGLLPGRSILAVNGQRVSNALDLLSALQRCACASEPRGCDSVILDVSAIPGML